jgi:hypothetical protein
MKQEQRGNVIVGIIIGVVIGLAAALAVAVYVTKVPVPFLNKGPSRSAEQDAAESRKNQNWDPNAPLYGKNPAKALPAAPGVTAPPPSTRRRMPRRSPAKPPGTARTGSRRRPPSPAVPRRPTRSVTSPLRVPAPAGAPIPSSISCRPVPSARPRMPRRSAPSCR